MLIIFLSTKNFGVGVSPDSTSYIFQAKQILDGKDISKTTWPPLFPAILALLSSIFRTSLLDIARILNTGLFGITIFVSGLIYRRYLKSSIIILFISIITVLVSPPLIPVYLMAWSEPPFIVFATFFLLFIDSYLKNKKRKNIFFSAFWVGLCCLTRYIGVSFILVGVICIVLVNKQRIKKMTIDLFNFIIISTTPITLWIIRNRIVLGSFTGKRAPSAYSYAENIRAMGNSILNWYIPDRVEMNRLLLATIFLMIGFFVGIYFKEIYSKEKQNLSWQLPFLVFIIVYLIFLVATSKSYHQLIDSRYLSPILIPLNLILISYMWEIIRIFRGRIAIKNLNVLLMPLLIFLILPIVRTGSAILTEFNDGRGYTSKIWRESETLKYYRDYTFNCDIYSNGSDVIQFYNGEVVKSMPRKKTGAIEVANIESLSEDWPIKENVCLVWFDEITWRDYYFTPEEILQVTELKSKIKFNDGNIYLLEPENSK